MNNKGFAITGILYTIFALFILLIFAALTNLSFKRQVLATSVAKMEEELAMELLETEEAPYETINNSNYAKYDGKYVFELSYTFEEKQHTTVCTAYLKKGDEIPQEVGDDFFLIPNDCSKYPEYKIEVDKNSVAEENKMILKEVYRFKDSD